MPIEESLFSYSNNYINNVFLLHYSFENMMLMTSTALLAFLLVWFVGADGFASFFRGVKAPVVQSNSWWDDLAPPFSMEHPHDGEWNHERQDVVHFCFLVHGHRGLSKDLSYLQAVMQSLSEQEKRKRYKQDGLVHDIIVHPAVCNEGKTTDGVANGGQRLVDEMMTVIETEMKHRKAKSVTVSVVGNSLGGIYGRYAIAKLGGAAQNLNFNIFCTTATPHLGVSKHTYFSLPRSAEIGVAHAMGNTGKDLFRLNDLMKNMATTPEYTVPLGSFRQRIAYANAYGTDFPVPAETAAFLSDRSTYPHHFVLENDVVVDEGGLVIARLHTPHIDDLQQHEIEKGEHTGDELVQMSTALDALGWKKVFVDIRKEIPIKITMRKRRISQGGDNRSGMRRDEDVCSIDNLKRKKVVESRDLATAIKLDASEGLHLPMGHNMIVAFSRSRISTYMNKGGRPVVDVLAKELVEDIFSWKEEEEEKTRYI
jgi:hypothetical protein